MKDPYSAGMLIATRGFINGQNLFYCILQSGSVCVNNVQLFHKMWLHKQHPYGIRYL